MLTAFVVLAFLTIVFGLLWLNSVFTSRANGAASQDSPLHPQSKELITVPDVFDEARIKADLARISNQPTALPQYIAQAQVRFTRDRQISVLEQWIKFYNAGKDVITARMELTRAHADLQQV